MRFDGVDDFLGQTGLRHSLTEGTVFLVAAPKSNPGFFRGFLATNEAGLNDYQTGFCIDQSGESGESYNKLNVEGRGFGGAVNLMTRSLPFGGFHTIETLLGSGEGGTQLFVDGQAHGRRDRTPGKLACDEITLGERFYSNDAPRPAMSPRSSKEDVAEVLLYDRVLSDTGAGRTSETTWSRSTPG